MAALSQNNQDVSLGGSYTEGLRSGDCIASDIVYKNSFVAFADAGGIQPVVGDLVFAGLATEKVDNSSGALGDKSVPYVRSGVIRIQNCSGMTRTDEGQPIYCATDNPADITNSSSTATLIGKMLKFHSATDVEIELNSTLG